MTVAAPDDATHSLPATLRGLRVIELADERGEYAGLMLAAMGAEVIKVEPPGGASTRRIGPFLDDEPAVDSSLYFWAYNRGKRSLVVDSSTDEGRATLRTLLSTADVVLDAGDTSLAQLLGSTPKQVINRHPALIYARLTDFGDDGPWAGYKGSDLVHLALGGPMMNTGYDPEPDGVYQTAPVAPQLWQAYHIAGEQLVMGVLAALVCRPKVGGQYLSCAVHEAVSKNTELDLMNWTMRRAPLLRQTCRHASETITPAPTIAQTQDGRWLSTNLLGAADRKKLVSFLAEFGVPCDVDLTDSPGDVGRSIPGSGDDALQSAQAADGMQRLMRKFSFERAPWRRAQDAGLICTPLRLPHENIDEEHWRQRGTFAQVAHPDLGRSFTYVARKWVSTATDFVVDAPPPTLDEAHGELAVILRRQQPRLGVPCSGGAPRRRSARGKPLPIDGVRVLDFTWFLASAGATRFLSAMGAECLKVEWRANPDTRLGAMAPVGGRAAREAATATLAGVTDSDMGGQFNNKNAGKRGISLNVRDPRGLEIARSLVRISDVVAEGFSPGVMDRWGLGYAELKALRPDVIYAQQSGMGASGSYGRLRAVGPAAAALAGTSEMSGQPGPAMPTGWGYSYLDWIGAYSFASAILGAVYHRDRTGAGQWIDASQCEAGMFLTGVPVLDWSANARPWQRIGNRSPYKAAAPHGAFPTFGTDRWIAIACFTEAEWLALARCIDEAWVGDARFEILAGRMTHQDELDRLLAQWTHRQDGYDLMSALQASGVAAGVCQTAQDRCERDPQLEHLEWLTEVTGTKIGRWPVAEVPVKMSKTPPYVGGFLDRGAPCYGEDNEYVLGELLGFGIGDIAELAADGVI